MVFFFGAKSALKPLLKNSRAGFSKRPRFTQNKNTKLSQTLQHRFTKHQLNSQIKTQESSFLTRTNQSWTQTSSIINGFKSSPRPRLRRQWAAIPALFFSFFGIGLLEPSLQFLSLKRFGFLGVFVAGWTEWLGFLLCIIGLWWHPKGNSWYWCQEDSYEFPIS